jgi:heat-inducible transcriptional repressor
MHPVIERDNTEIVLSERQQVILRAIVDEHVASATPVGSDTIVRKYFPAISPATVRHEMVTLASRGYVCNPHTSSGRVPTDAGYRYYVRRLMPRPELGPAEQCLIDHQFHQIERQLDEWLQLATTVLAQMTGLASFATSPVVRQGRLRHLDLIATQGRAALLVALLQEGTLHQQLVVRPEGLAQDQLDLTARRITDELRGQPATTVAAWGNARSPLDLVVRDSLLGLLRRVGQRAVTDVWYDGVRHLLAQPEFARAPDKARDILRAFEERRLLVEIADALGVERGVQVRIGDENVSPTLRECAVVATRYGSGDAAGVIGLVGPTRMPYARAIAILEYVEDVMSGLWADVSG